MERRARFGPLLRSEGTFWTIVAQRMARFGPLLRSEWHVLKGAFWTIVAERMARFGSLLRSERHVCAARARFGLVLHIEWYVWTMVEQGMARLHRDSNVLDQGLAADDAY